MDRQPKESKMTTVTQTPQRELTLADRCDACPAAAQVVVTFLNGELMFCGHHVKNNFESLKSKSVSIFDPNNYLNLIQ
jgi:hypothetical protein